jgi:transposase
MAYPFIGKEPAFPELEAYEVHHWPVVRAYSERLGLVGLINRLVPSEMAIDAGTIVLGLVIDTLSGRSPLYHLEAFFEPQDRALLLGREVEAKVFNDDTVGRVLDRLFEAGTQQIFSQLSRAAVERFAIPLKHVHHDTTSVTLYGDYLPGPGTEPALEITYGHSKDHRPDLKQLMVSVLCAGGDIPLWGRLADGNASDKTLNNELLSRISAHLGQFGVAPGAFIYIADSALITPDNLRQMGDETWFISRLPASYNAHGQVIEQVLAANAWEEVGRLAETPPSKNRPGAQYRVGEMPVSLYGQCYRAIVVHSSSHDRRQQKRLERELKHSEQQLQARLKKWLGVSYACEVDAKVAAEQLCAQPTKYHRLNVEIEAHPCYAPGRPKRDGSRTVKRLEYRLRGEVCADEAAIAKAREQAGCFVLLTNVPGEGEAGYRPAQVLASYKEQHGIEKNFGFLKDDAIVNALFLKTPERLEALGLILLISLLIWRLMEFEMRRHLQRTDTTLPGWDNKPTRRPTAYMVTIKFKGLLILKHNVHRRLARPLSDVQQAFLRALGLEEDIFMGAPHSPATG